MEPNAPLLDRGQAQATVELATRVQGCEGIVSTNALAVDEDLGDVRRPERAIISCSAARSAVTSTSLYDSPLAFKSAFALVQYGHQS